MVAIGLPAVSWVAMSVTRCVVSASRLIRVMYPCLAPATVAASSWPWKRKCVP